MALFVAFLADGMLRDVKITDHSSLPIRHVHFFLVYVVLLSTTFRGRSMKKN